MWRIGALVAWCLLLGACSVGPKYRRPDVPSVVRMNAANPDHHYCTLTVADNGIGFGQEHADKIFRMFERLHGRTEFEGTGMGLAICKKIVERHQGTITARSVLGIGTTFIVIVPQKQNG